MPRHVRIKPFPESEPPASFLSGKIIITASPGVTNYELLLIALQESKLKVEEVVSPSEKGSNQFGVRYSQENGLPYRPFPICWSAYGNRAAYMRNHDMVAYADAALILWEGINRHDIIRHLIRVCCHPGHHIRSEVDPTDRTIPCFVYNVQNGSSSFITPSHLYLLDVKQRPNGKRQKKS